MSAKQLVFGAAATVTFVGALYMALLYLSGSDSISALIVGGVLLAIIVWLAGV